MQIGQVIWRDIGHKNVQLKNAMLSEDGETLGVLANGRAVLLSRGGETTALPKKVHIDTYIAAAMSLDGQRLALASPRRLQIVNLASGQVHSADVDKPYHLAWRPDGQELIVGHMGNRLSWWSPEAQSYHSISLPVHRSYWQVVFAGNDILAVSIDEVRPNWICACSSSSVTTLQLPGDHFVTGWTACLGKAVVALSDNASLFELRVYSPLLQLVKQSAVEAGITALAAGPGSDWLAAGTVNGDLWIMDARTFAVRCKQALPTTISTVAACGQNYVLAGTTDGHLAVVELVS